MMHNSIKTGDHKKESLLIGGTLLVRGRLQGSTAAG